MEPDNSSVMTNIVRAVDHQKELDIKQAFFTNLMLLGFEARSFEVKYRIPFNKDMFCLPNKIGSEAVLYFLFDKLNPIMCKEEFRCIYAFPISNKKDEQQFRHVCNNWLSNIQKEEPEANLPRVAASLFMSPGGDKFYQLLFSFSNHVLLQVIKRENGIKNCLAYPELTSRTVMLDDVIGKTVQCAAIRHRKHYFQQLKQNLTVNNEWKQYSSELVKEYRQSTKKIRDLERDVRTENQISVEKSQRRGSPVSSRRKSVSSNFDLDSQGVRRTQRIQKVRDMWRQVEGFKTTDDKDREIVNSILEQTLDKQRKLTPGINATELNVKIPDLLLRECETEIHRRHVDNTYKGGKLNLLSVLQLWNLSLHLYIERLKQGSLPELDEETSVVTTQLHTHHVHLTNAQNLREKLSQDLLPHLKQSIERLRHEIDAVAVLPEHKTPNTSRITSLGFELMAPTPPMSFTPNDDTSSSYVDKHSMLYKTPTQDVSTPEAANQILDTMLQTSRKTANRHHHASPIYAPKINTTGGIPVSNRNTNNTKLSRNVTVKDRLPSKLGLGDIKHLSKDKDKNKEYKSSTVKSSTPVRNNPQLSRIMTTNTSVAPPPHDKSSKLRVLASPRPEAINHIRNGNMSTNRTSSYNTPAKTPVPLAQDILADKIVSAVIDGSPDQIVSPVITSLQTQLETQDINLLNPIAALDDTVFISRDKIGRSPTDKEDINNTRNKGEESAKEIVNSLSFQLDDMRQKLSFDEDINTSHLLRSEADGKTSENKNSADQSSTNKQTLMIRDADDSGLLTLESTKSLDNLVQSQDMDVQHQEYSDVSPPIRLKSPAYESEHRLNLSKEDLMTCENPMKESLLDLEASPYAFQSKSMEEELKLTSVDADLDAIFNTKTPKFNRRTGKLESLSSFASDIETINLEAPEDSLPLDNSISDQQPPTLVSFSPPDKHVRQADTDLRTTFPNDFKFVHNALTSDENDNLQNSNVPTASSSSLLTEITDKAPVKSPRSCFNALFTNDEDLLDNEELPEELGLELNDSFAPLKEGVHFTRTTPAKTPKSKTSSSMNTSSNSTTTLQEVDEISERCQRLRKVASEALSHVTLEIDEVIAKVDSSIHDKEQMLQSSSFFDGSVLSETDESVNYLKSGVQHRPMEDVTDSLNVFPSPYKGDVKVKKPTSQQSHLTIHDFNDDIFAEDDSLLLPVSPSNY
ncbi:hypothetical protein SNE40_004756 [Patella caerulea]|uniref:HAUS augmin-like complex subunit 6 N-terminal domain-containing protein n=1 Tax=Patella caerulea TaxID=87958 RepID=A0AAN8KA12_PATCE